MHLLHSRCRAKFVVRVQVKNCCPTLALHMIGEKSFTEDLSIVAFLKCHIAWYTISFFPLKTENYVTTPTIDAIRRRGNAFAIGLIDPISQAAKLRITVYTYFV